MRGVGRQEGKGGIEMRGMEWKEETKEETQGETKEETSLKLVTKWAYSQSMNNSSSKESNNNPAET